VDRCHLEVLKVIRVESLEGSLTLSCTCRDTWPRRSSSDSSRWPHSSSTSCPTGRGSTWSDAPNSFSFHNHNTDSRLMSTLLCSIIYPLPQFSVVFWCEPPICIWTAPACLPFFMLTWCRLCSCGNFLASATLRNVFVTLLFAYCFDDGNVLSMLSWLYPRAQIIFVQTHPFRNNHTCSHLSPQRPQYWCTYARGGK